MRLWDAAGATPDAAILAFSVGDDPQLDLELLPYDCLASAAHASALADAGVLTADEHAALQAGLAKAYQEALAGRLVIQAQQEDGHTASRFSSPRRQVKPAKRFTPVAHAMIR